jgi:hypothetical protein
LGRSIAPARVGKSKGQGMGGDGAGGETREGRGGEGSR